MTFLFRKDRNYIQGSDFFLYIQNFLKKRKFQSLNLICKEFINTEPKIKILSFSKKDKAYPLNYSVICIIKMRKNFFCITFKNSKKKILKNKPYDDKLFYPNFNAGEKTAKCNFSTHFKDIEILIALTKFWHEKKIKKKGKWIFTRLNLIKPFSNKMKKNFKIKITNNKFNKYTLSNVIQNKKKIGEIHFSLIN